MRDAPLGTPPEEVTLHRAFPNSSEQRLRLTLASRLRVHSPLFLSAPQRLCDSGYFAGWSCGQAIWPAVVVRTLHNVPPAVI